MASMEDLMATFSGGLHAGQQGNDLKDLHAKLAQTLQPAIPTYRPIAPAQSTSTHASNTGPMPPPAPASSWNSPPVTNNSYLQGQSPSFSALGAGGSPRQGGIVGVIASGGKRETGFNTQSNGGGGLGVPGPKPIGSTAGAAINGHSRPYHAEVLPTRASPKDTGGFSDDAFKPLWTGEPKRR